jgi:tRNA (cmo5U34)-methyltransferase
MSRSWQESDSDLYKRLGDVAVPRRRDMLATLLTLVPFGRDDEFDAVELGCGQGILADAFLRCFHRAHLTALDGSLAMREEAARRLEDDRDRVRILPFELDDASWRTLMEGAGCVLSSLVIHHLDGDGKRQLFADAAGSLAPGAALLVADLVHPIRDEARELFAATWDQIAEQQAAAGSSPQAYRAFMEERWNHYRHPDDIDRPSALADQLTWLREAGFSTVDCFWLQAGHAVYGGYLEGSNRGMLSYAEAYAAAGHALAR